MIWSEPDVSKKALMLQERDVGLMGFTCCALLKSTTDTLDVQRKVKATGTSWRAHKEKMGLEYHIERGSPFYTADLEP